MSNEYFAVSMADNDRRLIRSPRKASAVARARHLAKRHKKRFFVLRVSDVIDPTKHDTVSAPEGDEARQSWDQACELMQRERQIAIVWLRKAIRCADQLPIPEDARAALLTHIRGAQDVLDGSVPIVVDA